MNYKNPIISGYNPDPSICCVGEDYYLVNSTFEFFPSVPVYHSKNLINWTLESYCLTSKEQVDLEHCGSSGGIYAPTLRYHDSVFFMTTTNVSSGGNFIVHTKDIKNGWSEPHWVDQGGIDPSLLFDDDGKVYFTSTGSDELGQGILLCEVNPYTGEKLTESVIISHGCGGSYPEGPHLYKINGKYYLMLAEGGTEYGHMETMQRADSPYGPYEACPHNPILSHKEDMRAEIHCTGHAELMQDHNNNWWLVCLGVRPAGIAPNRLLLHHLGRETFLAPVKWSEDGWPIVGDNGLISLEMDGPLPGEPPFAVDRNFLDDFSMEAFSLHYNYLRNPHTENYIRDTENKRLILKGTRVTLNDADSPTWIGIRQKDFDTETHVRVSLLEQHQNIRAGITALYNDSYHYEIYITHEANCCKVCLAKHIHDIFVVTESAQIPDTKNISLKIKSDGERYSFYYSLNDKDYILLGTGLAVGLCSESTKTMTFTGTYLGMFAELGQAAFEDFEVKILEG